MAREDKTLQKREATQAEPVHEDVMAPRVDIYENDHEVLLVADLPGVGKDDLRIDVDRDQLTIMGKRKMEDVGTLIRGEYRARDYGRSFALPHGLDHSKISADLKHGVLYLHMPKGEQVKPRQITVKAG